MIAFDHVQRDDSGVLGDTARISVPCVGSDEMKFLRALSELRFPGGLAAEVARVACDAIGPLRATVNRGRVTLDFANRQLEMAPDELAFDEVELRSEIIGVEICRGRTGPRIIRTGLEPVRRNGWPLPRHVPASLDHGDVVSTCNGLFVVQLSPRPPRRPIAVESVRSLVERPQGWTEFAFVIEPAGAPLAVSVDRPTCRALVDLVLDGDGGRAFDATLLGEVERAVFDWTVHRMANAVSMHLFEGALSLVPTDDLDFDVSIACVAPVRVGGYTGVVHVATTQTGARAVARVLAPLVHESHRRNPALRGFTTPVAARIELGTVTPVELATIEIGDQFVCRQVAWRALGASAVHGVVVVGGTTIVVPAQLIWNDDGLRAQIAGPLPRKGTETMDIETGPTIVDPSDPFASVIDEIRVVVSVELAQRRMTLTELLNTREGGVIEFGAPLATDVALVIDGSTFARGEIVSVEGALGVRITSVGGRP